MKIGVREGFDIIGGACYLVKEARADLSFKLFKMMIDKNSPGLCVTRQHPERVRKEKQFKKIRIIWLCHTPGEDYHDPTALGSLLKIICKFIERKKNSVVLLDGFEYLMVNNGFLPTLSFVENINEFVMQRDGIVIIPVNPVALDEKEIALLERDLEILETPLVRTTLAASELIKMLEAY